MDECSQDSSEVAVDAYVRLGETTVCKSQKYYNYDSGTGVLVSGEKLRTLRRTSSTSSSTSPIAPNIHLSTAVLVPTPSSRAVSKMEARRILSRGSSAGLGVARSRAVGGVDVNVDGGMRLMG